MHDHLSKDGLIGQEQFFRDCHVVQLRDTMRSQVALKWSIRAGRLDESSRSELADGDMVRVTIPTIWTEGDHHIGFHAAYLPNDLCYHLCWRSLVQIAIDVIQKLNTANTQHFSRGPQFLLAPLTKSLQTWI